MPNPFDHLHIKRRTAGSSNELSFDVLDAARDSSDTGKSRSVRIPMGPRISQGKPKAPQGTYGGMGSTATFSATAEVERRKRARRNRTIRLWVVGVVVVVALAAAGAFFGYRLYQERDDFTVRFEMIVAQLSDIDKAMVQVDSLMVDPINSVEADERKAILEEFPRVTSSLERVIADTRALKDDPVAPSDDTVFASLESAALAREDMLVAAEDAFKLSEIANKHIGSANRAWGKVLAGDSAAREASSIANTASTESETLEVYEKTRAAIDSMTSARSELDLLSREVANVDFSAETTYIDKRIEALEAGVESADALLANNREAAISANAAYNANEQEAAALAAGLPPSISEQVRAQYVDETKRLVDIYSAARSRATTADAAIRSRLA